jgi:hypothetical protein
VFLTRSLSLGVILVNGAWDNRVMVIANFMLESAMVAWVSLLAWSFLGWARGSCVAAAALLPMFLVCDWESIMWSNQTQFVFMAFGSLLASPSARAAPFAPSPDGGPWPPRSSRSGAWRRASSRRSA